MATDFRFPDVGEGIHEGEIVTWLVKEGGFIKADQPLVEIETDKAVVEVPSPVAGTILKLHAREGDTVRVGQVIATIGAVGEKISGQAAPSAAALQQTPPSPSSPFTSANPVSPASSPILGRALATPAVRKAAREMKVDLAAIRGSGPGGRIELSDLTSAALGKGGRQARFGRSSGSDGSAAGQAGSGHGRKSPDRETAVAFEQYGRVLKLPLKGSRKIIAERMTLSAQTIPHVTHMDEADVTDLWAIREQEKSVAENQGFKLTFLPFVIKACTKALKNHPFLNASLSMSSAESAWEIVLKQYYNIGFAVDTGESLIVPVLKKADEMTILEIAQRVQKLSDAARDRSIDPQDMKGASFSITNVGSIGGIHFTPIINPPEAAILGMGRIADQPVVKDGKIAIRKILPLMLAFDHRILDGAKAARFMNDVKRHLEDPNLFLVDVV